MADPLFKTEGSLYRRAVPTTTNNDDDDDEDWVDRSIPSTPMDEGPPEAGPSSSGFSYQTRERSSTPKSPNASVKRERSPSPDMSVKDEGGRDDTPPLREVNEDDLDESDEHEPEDERQCRICFSGVEEEPSMGRLISPCLCTGSVRVSASHLMIRRQVSQADRVVRPWWVIRARCRDAVLTMISHMYQRMAGVW